MFVLCRGCVFGADEVAKARTDSAETQRGGVLRRAAEGARNLLRGERHEIFATICARPGLKASFQRMF